MLEHGGQLQRAAEHYGIPIERWLDLSTGINPNGWPVPPLNTRVWNRLPETDDGLLETAATYYGTPQLLPVAGSQTAIQAIPRLRAPCHVGVLAPGYAEHAYAWRQARHQIEPLASSNIDASLARLDVLVLANPNNPTGERFDVETLLRWHATLGMKDGWLVVDEAFIDAAPERSLAAFSARPGLIVLRSLGKFFGLAGARVGFVLAEPSFLQILGELLGPWTVSGPSRHVARLTLADSAWQVETRQRLRHDTQRLRETLFACGLTPSGSTELFQWVLTPHATALHERLARHGILVRKFESPASLRFGLPANETEWRHLRTALESLAIAEVHT
jgi:cobalamin biosynthesis protein CobC